MDPRLGEWWRRHAWTIAILGAAFSMAFLVRTVFVLPILHQFGPLYLYGGGSDSFYHSRVMTSIIQTHHNLIDDKMLRYPRGAINPREPLFDWMNAVVGVLFAPFFGGGVAGSISAGAFMLDLDGPLWAALSVVPIYLIGREVSSRRMGLIAALIYPFLVASIDSSTFGYANYLSFYTFVILIALYSYIRTVKAAGTKRWVGSFRSPRDVLRGVRAYLKGERTSVKWAVFTGVSMGALTLAWQGYTYFVLIVIVFLFAAMIVERVRRVDSFGLYVSTWIVGLIGFPMAIPYYQAQGLLLSWLEVPALIWFAGLLILYPFVAMRDSPWVVSVPVLAGIVVAAVGALDLLDHAAFVNVVTGQGYFVKTLIYSTVAEAQAPSIDSLILGYGVLTFFVAFVGLGLVGWRLARQRFPRALLLFLLIGVVSIYLPVSAAKFFYIGSPAFALLPAEAIARALDVAGYPSLRRTVASLSDRRSQLGAFRRAFKARHVLVMALLLLLVVPNVWYAVDAGIPYNTKSQYDSQIYNTLPPGIRSNASSASSFYLGAAGVQLDTITQYDEAGYNWLSEQDTNLPPDQRPAFVSWWDYGFQAVAEGGHPTVADNFQNGIDPAGNFLLSQSEPGAIAILATTLLQAEQNVSGSVYLTPGLNALIARDGLSVSTVHNLMVNTSGDISTVLRHPETYLAVDPNNIDGTNAMYLTMAHYVSSTLGLNGTVQFYDDVQGYTGWSIRYAMTDSRLFPFSGQNTGIFYAPADLTDRVIGPGGAPTAFYTLSEIGSDGNTYAYGNLPAGVSAVNVQINYLPAFYNTMIFHTFIGYNGTQAGLGPGIPGLAQSLASDPLEPGWMLQHFRVVYKTGFYCPYSNPNSHPGCFSPMNLIEAKRLAKANNGTADGLATDYFQGGETILEYYPGVPLTGTVDLTNGAPASGVRVTVDDEWGIPHQSVLTSSDGSYTVVLPPGNDTVNVTTGTLNGLAQQGVTLLTSYDVTIPNALGESLAPPTMLHSFTLKPSAIQGFVYWNVANNTTFTPSVDPVVPGAQVHLWANGLPRYSLLTDASGSFSIANVPPGTYNFSVVYNGANFTESPVAVKPGPTVNATASLTPGSVSGTVGNPDHSRSVGAVVHLVPSTGVAYAATTNSSGAFAISNVAPGNYSLSARSPDGSLGTSPVLVTVGRTASKLTETLNLSAFVTLDLTVVAGGSPAAGIPVRFTPISAFELPTPPTSNTTGRSAPPVVSANASVFFTDSNGQVSAFVPRTNYSVYALGLVGSSFEAGYASAFVGSASPNEFSLAPLFLFPSEPLSGTIATPGGPLAGSTTQIRAYGSNGAFVSFAANSSGRYRVELPPGTYTVEAYVTSTSTSSPPLAAIGVATVNGPTTLSLTLGAAFYFHAIAGAATTGSTTGSAPYPAGGAAVTITLPPSGATISTFAQENGNVTQILPTTLPAGTTYCLFVRADGYEPYHECGYTGSGLSGLSQIPLTLTPVPIAVNVTGLPSNATLTVNFTGVSPTAQSVVLRGNGVLSSTITPGTYTLSGWAPTNASRTLYLPASVENVTVPVGAAFDNFTFTVYRQVRSEGLLELPAGVANSSITLRLSSSTFNRTVQGGAFEAGFPAPVGTYRVYASSSSANGTYASFSNVSINATGVVRPAVDLTGAAVRLTGSTVTTTGASVNGTFPVTLTGGGFQLTAVSSGGSFSAGVPAGITFSVSAATSGLVGSGVNQRYESFLTVPGASCTSAVGGSVCVVKFTATVELAPVSGRYLLGGTASNLDGRVTFVGPAPSVTATVVSVVNGQFSATILPGRYQLYATGSAGNGAPIFGNWSTLTVGPSGTSVAVGLASTWTDTVSVVAPVNSSVSGATLTVRAQGGPSLVFTNVTPGTPTLLSLPPAVYTITVNGTTYPYGLPTNATATVTVPLLSGNLGTVIDLQNIFTTTARVSVLGSSTVHVGNGGNATFALSVTDTGNAPEHLHLVGAPSSLGFVFTPSNVSLTPTGAGSTGSVTVVVNVPSGTATNHPDLVLEALLPSGDVAGIARPTPSIVVSPLYALSVGQGVESAVAPRAATVNFYVANPGNAPETVSVGISDLSRLASLGWNAQVLQGRTALIAPISLGPSGNTSLIVKLTEAGSGGGLPGTVTVFASVTNVSGSVSAYATLSIPTVSINANGSAIQVTGPGLGSPNWYPDWFPPVIALVPAAAFLVGVVTWRWYRTRRWVRR